MPQPEVVVAGRRSRLDDVLGPGSAELRAARGRFVVRRGDGTEIEIDDPSGSLAAWFRSGRATSPVVRPHRIVRWAGSRVLGITRALLSVA